MSRLLNMVFRTPFVLSEGMRSNRKRVSKCVVPTRCVGDLESPWIMRRNHHVPSTHDKWPEDAPHCTCIILPCCFCDKLRCLHQPKQAVTNCKASPQSSCCYVEGLCCIAYVHICMRRKILCCHVQCQPHTHNLAYTRGHRVVYARKQTSRITAPCLRPLHGHLARFWYPAT